MIPNKIQVKLPAQSADRSWLQDSLEIFHRWISERVLNELLIDVADYRHVHQGPSIALIGHECHYYLDESGGQLGLCCFRKRGFVEGRDPLLDALHRTLRVCERLQQDLKRPQPLFDTAALEVRIVDRRVVTGASQGTEAFTAATRERLEAIYASVPTIEGLGPDRLPGVRLRWSEAPPLERLRQRVELALDSSPATQPAAPPAE